MPKRISQETLKSVEKALEGGAKLRPTAKKFKLAIGTVHRIKHGEHHLQAPKKKLKKAS